eukprot:jgi/Botrbrau1/9901/Bobra.0012s0004.1
MGTCVSKPAGFEDIECSKKTREVCKPADGDCDTPLGGSHRKPSPFHSVASSGRRSFSRKQENEFYDSAYPDAAEQLSVSEQLSSSDNSSSLQPASACDSREPSAAPPPEEQDQDLSDVLNGGAYVPAKFGPPRPPCNPERVATVRQIDLLDEPPDPKLDHLLTLANTVMRTDIALCTLLDSDRIFISSSAGGFIPPGAEVAWKNLTMCGWVLTPDNNEVLVVEDMKCDARFSEVCLPGFERSYCGAPMVSSDGHRIGTFCVGGKTPRKFGQTEVQMLANMSEMATREIEASHVAARQRRQEALLLRAVDALTMPFMIVDTSTPKWDLSYINGAACELIGMARNTLLSKALWELFRSQNSNSMSPGQELWKLHQDQVKNGEEFTLRGMSLMTASSAPTIPVQSACKSLFTLSFRPAGTDILDEHTIPIGVPAFVGGDSEWQGQPYYVVKMEQTLAILDRSTWEACPQALRPIPFEGLKLGPILGKGSFGRVYRGIYNGSPVAVKVMDDNKVVRAADGRPLEAVITGSEPHPSIVTCLGHSSTASGPPVMHDSAHSRLGDMSETETWLLLEYCDRGSVSDAVNKGWFRKTPISRDQPPDLDKIIDTAYEIADGMAYLHARGVVHGDLTGGNVLLASDPNPTRGFVAKVSDFGMAREVDVDERIQTRMYGTITHMPPERLSCHVLDKNTDKYAYGVLLWEMAEGVRAWAGLTHAQIWNTVAIQKRQLHLSEGLPADYVALVQALLSHVPEARPSFEEVKQCLQRMKDVRAVGGGLCKSTLCRPSLLPPVIHEEIAVA